MNRHGSGIKAMENRSNFTSISEPSCTWRRDIISCVKVLLIAASFILPALSPWLTASAQSSPAAALDNFIGKPRLIVLSDIGNEPDDQMSFVRLLLYSNELDIEGLIAVTSTWQRNRLQPETMHQLIKAYGEVRPRLLEHAVGWPEASRLDSIVKPGQPAYGMAAVGSDRMSPGAEAIISSVDRPDTRPVWVSLWGGASTLAQALLHVRSTRSSAELDQFIRKLRVYSISDQDDAGPWIRREFPGLFYIVKPTGPDASEYYYATWTGISGDVYYRNCAGADTTTVTNEWLDEHIRSKGPLGRHYPKFAFIMEGDTPSFLGLIDNGLNSYRNPGWGGWGGRYVYLQPYGESHPIWAQGGDLFSRVTSQDSVTGSNGQVYVSDQATIWRWREAFQNDFSARMDWTIKPRGEANHNPVINVNGEDGTAPITIEAKVGAPIILDASRSSDPDGQSLKFKWFHYTEAGFAPGQSMAAVAIAQADSPRAIVTPTAACRPLWLSGPGARCESGVAHIILAVTDSGTPQLTSYRRIILKIRPAITTAGAAVKN